MISEGDFRMDFRVRKEGDSGGNRDRNLWKDERMISDEDDFLKRRRRSG